MEEAKKVFKLEYFIILFSVVSFLVSWYFATNYRNEIQDEKINKVTAQEHLLDARVSQLEQRQAISDTQNAVIRVQLDAIQVDLKEIKQELRKVQR